MFRLIWYTVTLDSIYMYIAEFQIQSIVTIMYFVFFLLIQKVNESNKHQEVLKMIHKINGKIVFFQIRSGRPRPTFVYQQGIK